MASGKIAILPPDRLGDGILATVMAHNLQQHGYTTTLFNRFMFEMKDWFSGQNIQPFPDLQRVDEVMRGYDKIISVYSTPLHETTHNLGDRYKLFRGDSFNRKQTLLWNILTICKDFFHIENPVVDNSVKPPKELEHRKFSSRVIIHPMSTNKKKNWPVEKFIALADWLAEKKFEPVFVVSPMEREQWQNLLNNKYQLPVFPTIDHLARYVYESGYMIGNDSGVGHLASNLGLRTLIMFGRKSTARIWRPAWGQGRIIVPFQLPGATLQMKYWKAMVSVRKVATNFDKLL